MPYPKEGDIINTTDYSGKKVVFTRDKWNEKKDDHPELTKDKFISCIIRAIENPDEVWQDYGDFSKGKFNKRCYYKKYSATSYAKVVIRIRGNPREIVTAYELDYIKETKYTGLRRYV